MANGLKLYAIERPKGAEFWNRIVHEYDEIDNQKVYEGVQAAVRDVPHFLKHIDDSIR